MTASIGSIVPENTQSTNYTHISAVKLSYDYVNVAMLAMRLLASTPQVKTSFQAARNELAFEAAIDQLPLLGVGSSFARVQDESQIYNLALASDQRASGTSSAGSSLLPLSLPSPTLTLIRSHPAGPSSPSKSPIP